MSSTKQQRARRQTAPSGPPRKPTAKETQSSLQALDEQSPSTFELKTPGWSNELEFSQWFNGVKGDLIEESYGEYQYDRRWDGYRRCTD
jgi:hypothetical protein